MREPQVDGLTGLPNRIAFTAFAEQQLAICEKSGARFALLLADIDQMLAFNDQHGHQVGDRILRMVAARLGGALRATDMVARVGGDEFALAVPLTPNDDIDAIAGTLLDEIAKPYLLALLTMGLSASIGVAVYPDAGTSVSELMSNADKAMYRAKQAGRGRYALAGAGETP